MQSFIDAAAHNPRWNWYAIADSAQHRDLPGALTCSGGLMRCLFDMTPDSPLAANAPHLVQLEQPDDGAVAWSWITRNASRKPCVTVLASDVDFDTLYAHLRQFTEVLLPDGDDMFFAFWDPAILGVLVGQNDDPTLYVRGPVLNAVQYATFTQHIAGWWYWDRDGAIRSLQIVAAEKERANLPLHLNQMQVDDLVEASVPDHVLYHIDLNQPQLLSDIDREQRYPLIRKHLQDARDIKLEAMSDLVNYVCAALIYKAQFQVDPIITALLDQVKMGKLKLTQALQKMP